MTYIDFNMTAGHGQIGKYWNKGPYKFVFVVYQSILFNLSPNGCDSNCIKVQRALNAEVNSLTTRVGLHYGPAAAQNRFLISNLKQPNKIAGEGVIWRVDYDSVGIF